MACFCDAIYGEHTIERRTRMRYMLLEMFRNQVFDRNEQLNPHCFEFPAVKAFVNRLHLIHPDVIPKSAETFYNIDTCKFRLEAVAFLQRNRDVGVITDKFVFGYLMCQLFRVAIVYYQPEEVHLGSASTYILHIKHENQRFTLMEPVVKQKRNSFGGAKGTLYNESKLLLPIYMMDHKIRLAPPCIKGHQVHCCVIDVVDDMIHTLYGNNLYVFMNNIHNVIGHCRSDKCHFFIVEVGMLMVVSASSLDDAREIVARELMQTI